jgi:hypothetical protein
VIIGLIADTHGLVRPQIFGAFEGVDLILHAGDVGGPAVLDELRPIAPIHAVYGNTDPPGEPGLAARLHLDLAGRSVHVSHGHEVGRPTPAALAARYEADVIVYGHTHKPLIEYVGSTLVVNPGAAGPRRFDLQPSVARLTIADGAVDVEIVWL